MTNLGNIGLFGMVAWTNHALLSVGNSRNSRKIQIQIDPLAFMKMRLKMFVENGSHFVEA